MCGGRVWVVCGSCCGDAAKVSGSPTARRTHDRRTCRGRAGMVSGSPTARRTLARRTCRGRAGMVSGSHTARRTLARRTCRGRAGMVYGSHTARRTLARNTIDGAARLAALRQTLEGPHWPVARASCALLPTINRCIDTSDHPARLAKDLRDT